MVHYTAITLKLNTKPWKQGGVTSCENYRQQLHNIANKFDCQLGKVCGVELDEYCQLHVHTTLVSNKILHRANICKYYRRTFKKHSIWLVPVTNEEAWDDYCLKTGNQEELYHWLCRYYDNNYPEQFNKETAIRNNETIKIPENIFLNSKNHWYIDNKSLNLNPQFID